MTKPKTNLAAKDFPARSDANARFSLAYYRDANVVKFLSFSPSGLQPFELTPDAYDRRFKGRFLEPLDRIILSLLRNTQKEYLPGPDSAATLLEMYEMSTTDGKGLEALDSAALTAHYNKLAEAVGRGAVKGFKSKAEAIKRIEALQAEARRPTKKQEEAAAKRQQEEATATAKPAKKAAKKAAEKPEDSAAMGSVASALTVLADSTRQRKEEKFPSAAKKAAKKAEAAAKKPAAKKAAGQGTGIGAFCSGLIVSGKSNEEVLAAVREKFPSAATSAASVAWYRNKLRAEGKV